MATIIIPKNISKDKELIAVSKKEYEEFSVWQKKAKSKKQKFGIREELKVWEKATDEDLEKIEDDCLGRLMKDAEKEKNIPLSKVKSLIK